MYQNSWANSEWICLYWSWWNMKYYIFLGLIRVALLVYPPPTRPLGPLPDPYPIPRGYLIHTGKKSNKNHYFSIKIWKIFKKSPNFLSQWGQLKVFTITVFHPKKSHCKKIIDLREHVSVNFRFSYWSFWFLFLSTWIWRKKDTHAFIRYGGNGEVYPPPTPTRPLVITRPLPDITPTRLRPMQNL